jgi:hypothetical protein
MVWSGDFTYIVQYFLMPFCGSIIALVFYEFVFVKSQEYLNEGDDASSSGSHKDLVMPDEPSAPPKNSAKSLDNEEDLTAA